MKIKNIKCSILSEGLVKEGLKRRENYKFTVNNVKIFIFGHSPNLLNMTGLKSFKDIEEVMKIIEKKHKIKCKEVTIDNIFISHKDNKNIKLSNVFHYVQQKFKHLYLADYNVELFPGMFLKPQCSKWPTIILFRTGSFTIMGGKDIQSIMKAQSLIVNIIDYFVNS